MPPALLNYQLSHTHDCAACRVCAGGRGPWVKGPTVTGHLFRDLVIAQ